MSRKTIEKSFMDSKRCKVELPLYKLTIEELAELKNFAETVGYTADRQKFLIQCIKLKSINWAEKWNSLKLVKQQGLEYLQIYYGNEEGFIQYTEINKKKRKGFPNTIEYWKKKGFTDEAAKAEAFRIQQERNQKTVELKLSKNANSRTCRQIGFWIEQGFNIGEAKDKIKQIQTHNGYDYFTNKFPSLTKEEIKILQDERTNNWLLALKNNPKNNNIGYKRSHSLKRYIERANNDEGIGIKNYLNYWNTRNNLFATFGRASKESLLIFLPISNWLKERNIKHYLGIEGSKEWWMYNKTSKSMYFYDFTIPELKIIIEYNGETWHPNPNWGETTWGNWVHPHTKENADQRFLFDTHKINFAALQNWEVIQIFSSEIKDDVIAKMKTVLQEKLFL